jgi:hypothetical protein
VTAPNTFEMQARARKCSLVCNVLVERLIELLDKDPSLWESAAREAGVNPPSQVSREMIKNMLRDATR